MLKTATRMIVSPRGEVAGVIIDAPVVRERVDAKVANMPGEQRTSEHLVRLWANDEIARMVQGVVDHRREAVELAGKYQLVTPVSGAVVLESKAQHDAAGLQPVPEGTVPTIPEPEEWALAVVALLMIFLAARRLRASASEAISCH